MTKEFGDIFFFYAFSIYKIKDFIKTFLQTHFREI
jgi:hypothetical protein